MYIPTHTLTHSLTHARTRTHTHTHTHILGSGAREKPAAGMWVGFPVKTVTPVEGWQCPRCHDVVADLPADCPVIIVAP